MNKRQLNALRTALPEVSERVIEQIMADVPAYADAFAGQMGENIASAVQVALRGFVRMMAEPTEEGGASPATPAVEGAYALGRGEARSGRSVDALLSAYRIGARVSWREMSAIAVHEKVAGPILAEFAEMVFAYIDELSAASVAGHGDEIATTGRVLERYRSHLARQLINGAAAEVLDAAAERAEWAPPRTLTAVVLPSPQARAALALLDERTLAVTITLPEGEEDDAVCLLVPDIGRSRRLLARRLSRRSAVIGPTRPWQRARSSYQRAVRATALPADESGVLDTEDHLAHLIVTADSEALEDLRARVLSPLKGMREGTQDKLAETLRSWLLQGGRRDAVATELFVHPQTVRYRMSQIRAAYGDRLEDPRWVRDLVIGLCLP